MLALEGIDKKRADRIDLKKITLWNDILKLGNPLSPNWLKLPIVHLS